jgi:beta-D-xylosidase 4
MHFLSAAVVLGASLVSTSYAIGPDCTNGPLSTNAICDVNASPSKRAAALVAAMETQEKLDNLVRYACLSEFLR